MDHRDLYFPDGTVPSNFILEEFLRICEQTPGAVAVHCKVRICTSFFFSVRSLVWLKNDWCFFSFIPVAYSYFKVLICFNSGVFHYSFHERRSGSSLFWFTFYLSFYYCGYPKNSKCPTHVFLLILSVFYINFREFFLLKHHHFLMHLIRVL